jgi:hypothetical protein
MRRKSKPLGIKMTGDGLPVRHGRAICGEASAGGISGRVIERRETPTEVRPPQLAAASL